MGSFFQHKEMELVWAPFLRSIVASLLGIFVHANLELILYKSLQQWKQSSRALLFWCCTIPEFLPSSHHQIPSWRGHEEAAETNLAVGVCSHPTGLLLPPWSLLMVPEKQRGQEMEENSSLQPGLGSSWCRSAGLRCCTWGWICSMDFS